MTDRARRAAESTAVTNDEVGLAAEEWAALFNQVDPEEVQRLIIGAASDEYFDDRTNLFLANQTKPTDAALVLSSGWGTLDGGDDYVIVRFDGDAWIVDSDQVDWGALGRAAFSFDDDDAF